MSAAQRERFLANIEAETARLQSLSERLLRLAQVEQRRGLEDRSRVAVHALVEELLAECAPRLELAGVTVVNEVPVTTAVTGERFLLRQAVLNLVDNAIDFTPAGGSIRIGSTSGPDAGTPLTLWVRNDGEAIPDYALPRVTERFYSLARPGSGRKSTGLGLNLVHEVAQLHGGHFRIVNEA